MLNEKFIENLDDYEATVVYVHYCTGEDHIGTRMMASFDGHYNFVTSSICSLRIMDLAISLMSFSLELVQVTLVCFTR